MTKLQTADGQLTFMKSDTLPPRTIMCSPDVYAELEKLPSARKVKAQEQNDE